MMSKPHSLWNTQWTLKMQEAIRQASFLIHSLPSSLNGIYTLLPKGRKKSSFSCTGCFRPKIQGSLLGQGDFPNNTLKQFCSLWLIHRERAVRLKVKFTITLSHWSAWLPRVHTKWLHKAILIWGDWITLLQMQFIHFVHLETSHFFWSCTLHINTVKIT